MNNKGAIGVVLGMPLAFATVAGIMVIAAAVSAPQFRTDRAVEECVKDGNSKSYCVELVSTLPESEKINMIRDKHRKLKGVDY